jgi:hypothetical protein
MERNYMKLTMIIAFMANIICVASSLHAAAKPSELGKDMLPLMEQESVEKHANFGGKLDAGDKEGKEEARSQERLKDVTKLITCSVCTKGTHPALTLAYKPTCHSDKSIEHAICRPCGQGIATKKMSVPTKECCADEFVGNVKCAVLLELADKYSQVEGLSFEERAKLLSGLMQPESQPECAICLQEFAPEKQFTRDYKTLLKCQHAFHTDCMRRHFRANKSDCPLCKKRAPLVERYLILGELVQVRPAQHRFEADAVMDALERYALVQEINAIPEAPPAPAVVPPAPPAQPAVDPGAVVGRERRKKLRALCAAHVIGFGTLATLANLRFLANWIIKGNVWNEGQLLKMMAMANGSVVGFGWLCCRPDRSLDAFFARYDRTKEWIGRHKKKIAGGTVLGLVAVGYLYKKLKRGNVPVIEAIDVNTITEYREEQLRALTSGESTVRYYMSKLEEK